MGWVEINQTEYLSLFKKEKPNLSVFSSGTAMAGSWMGEMYFAEDYILTEWGFAKSDLPFIKSLKEHGEWHYWKWEGPAPQDCDNCGNKTQDTGISLGKIVPMCQECREKEEG
jgi:hypothetical protein